MTKLIPAIERPMTLPDALHLLKRMRYRFLKKLISLDLKIEGVRIDSAAI